LVIGGSSVALSVATRSYRRIAGDHHMPLATAPLKARFASGIRSKTYTTNWDTIVIRGMDVARIALQVL
jgi:hypothetical protein